MARKMSSAPASRADAPRQQHHRNLRRGGPGRPAGRRNKVPPSVKASVKAVLEEVAGSNREEIKAAILKGVNSKPPHSLRYVEVIAHYVDGKPAETIKLKGPVLLPPMQILLNPDGIESKAKE
jgi:hypothetical protein